MANMEKANEAAHRLVQTTQDSYRAVVDHAVGLQERNVRFAQGLVEDSIRGLRQQSERNWDMAEELVERAEEQSEAFRSFVEKSVGTYMGFLYAPFSYPKEGLEAAKKGIAR